MRPAALLLTLACLGGCTTPQSNTDLPTAKVERPLWAETLRDDVRNAQNPEERQRFKDVWGNHLSWEMPPYRPLTEQTQDSVKAWNNVLRKPE